MPLGHRRNWSGTADYIPLWTTASNIATVAQAAK
jgi:hypothetical protein